MEPLSADAESRVCGHIAALTAEMDKARAVLAGYLGRPLMGKDTLLVLAEGAVARGNTSEDDLAKAESERDAARTEVDAWKDASGLERGGSPEHVGPDHLRADLKKRDDEAWALRRLAEQRLAERNSTESEAEALRERVTTLEAERDKAVARAEREWEERQALNHAAEARVKELTEKLAGARNAALEEAAIAAESPGWKTRRGDETAQRIRARASQSPPAPTQCSVCGKPATCWGRRSGEARPSDPACGECCAHDTGECERIASTPPALVDAVGPVAEQVRLNEEVHRLPDAGVMPIKLTAAQGRAVLAAYDAAKGVRGTSVSPPILLARNPVDTRPAAPAAPRPRRPEPAPSVPAFKAERATHGGYHGPRAVRQAIQYAPPGVQVDAFRALGSLAADHMRLRQQANVAESMRALSLETAGAVPSPPAAEIRASPRLVDAVRQALGQLRDGPAGRVGDAIATLSDALGGTLVSPSTALAWVTDGETEGAEHVVFARCEGRARVLAGRATGDAPRHVKIRREPRFDEHAPGPVPVSALLDAGWWYECAWCYHPVADEGCERCADDANADVLAEPVVTDDNAWCSVACQEAWAEDMQRHREHEASARRQALATLPDATVEFIATDSVTLRVPGCLGSVKFDLATGHIWVSARDIHVARAMGHIEPLSTWESEGGAR
ncbi:hypothetical protein [Myxococcus sp. AS-1-15]|uniref:hypothetical protein n=1 Tax=Myxococcus sp. AS-1-15 TaxID=2874600 RepID=UPI001CBB8590|nr:hypothetical protein [Myxococcus sp. AS-1-15]MBZ4402017.1 hypothetical protein [Myxococcus sp. AS-1-15]